MYPRKGDCCSAVRPKNLRQAWRQVNTTPLALFLNTSKQVRQQPPAIFGGVGNSQVGSQSCWKPKVNLALGHTWPSWFFHRTKREIHTQGKKLMPISSKSPRSPWLPKTCVKTCFNQAVQSWMILAYHELGPFFMQSWNSVGKRITLELGGGFM